MASLHSNKSNDSLHSDDDIDTIHIFDITNGAFPKQIPDHIESGDTIEFQTQKTDEYDIFQVYKDENDYYRIHNGLELLNIKTNTSVNKRRLLLSFALQQSEIEFYFCIIPSTQRETFSQSRQYPGEYCERNRLILHKNELKFSLNDNKESQKVILHKGDTIEIDWASKRGSGYRIEEKRYCPISGGLYKIEQTLDFTTTRAVSKGKFVKTFNEFGTSFLFRLTETNQIHDIIVCLIKEKFRIKYMEITDTNIQPNVIRIEQNDSIRFEWNTKQKQTMTQIESFIIDEEKQQSIELKIAGKHFFWPNEPSCRGYMIHEFKETGIFCFKTTNHQIGTIVVEPKINIHSLPVFGDELILKINTNDLIQFEWKMTDSQEEPILITIDANSSVVPDAAGGLIGIFDCSMHKCVKVEPFFRHHFHTCEAFLLNIPQHGLYTFAYSDNRDDVMLSVIVENTITNHHVAFNEENIFEPNTKIINRYDQVWFDSLSTTFANIYRTDEYGNYVEGNKALFQPQLNNVNYFMQSFPQIGIYYFSTDMNHDRRNKSSTSSPLAIIVLPDIRFHYKLIRLGDFDSPAIITNINDFIIWQFEQIIRFNVIQLRSNETLQDLVACHDRAVPGRNRQCLAVECIMPGTFYFANPEFERVSGSEQDRLISTIIIDPPFSQACFLITNRQFVPNVLYISQHDTVSWILLNNNQYHRISVESNENKQEANENNRLDRSIEQHVHDLHYLYTFDQYGQFTIRSNRFNDTATVIVYPEDIIRSQKKRVPGPELIEEIDTLSPYGTQVHLKCSNQDATIFYTLDGTLPTRRHDNVHTYDSNEGISFLQSGLHVLRAYATENEKLSSTIVTSSPTFVMENEELETMSELLSMWNSTKIILSASIQYPNKLYGKIEVEPTSSTDLIDHFELFVDDVAQRVNLAPTDVKFSAEGFAGGEQYEIHIVAYPKQHIVDAEPIPSNRRAFEIKREIQGGAPLISLAVSNEQSTIFLMWAHLGDHVSEYVVYVDDIETTIILEKDFNDFFGIQFHGAQPQKRYLLHVEAKIKNSQEVRKSNIIAVNPPLEMPLKEQLIDRYFAYITVNAETPPADMRLEVIHLDRFPHRRPEPQRKVESLPITNGLRNAIPTISFKQNSNGITLFWTKTAPIVSDFVDSYRIMVDGEQYGELISPQDEPTFQLDLPPGKYECYLTVIPKDKDQETYESNILEIDIPPTADNKSEHDRTKEPSHVPVHKVLEQKDIPISKLNVQSINASSIRVSWNLDRPVPEEALVTMYEVHIRGQTFPDKITSDQKLQQDDYTEHVWNVSSSPLEITGISDRYEYTVFVRALFTIQGLDDTKYATTTSKEVTTTRVIPLIDLLPRPVLKVTRIGLQMVNLSWKFDDSIDQSSIKGYRIILNTKPTETLSPNQHEYELRNLKPGTTNDIQVSVTCHPDFVDEKISAPVRIVCPSRPQPPTIQSIPTEKPFSIGIKWKIDDNDQDEITTFKIFLDGKLHGEIDTDSHHSFKYEFIRLQADQIYSIYVKTCLGQKKLDENIYQCDIESKASSELSLKCIAPPKGTPPRIERMHPNGIDIVWDAPVEDGDVKVIGYQILKNGRAIGKSIPIDKRRASIRDLEIGNRYSLQVVPITNQPGGTLFETGEEYNAERHGHYLPGPKLDVDFTDLVQIPSKIWIENISGCSAVVCWSPIGSTSNTNIQPDNYQLFVWNSEEQTRDQATVISISRDKTNHQLQDLQSATTYEIQLEAIKRRRYPKTTETYIVSTTSKILTFDTGAPPDAPLNLYVTTCTNTAVRIGFDAFIEHSAEIITLRVHCEPVSSGKHRREIILDLTPDSTEFILSNLTERTDYNVIIYAITEEYLNEIHCRNVSQLPKNLQSSDWLTNKSLQFTTSGCEPASQLHIHASTIESIQLEWVSPIAYGSTKFLGQILRWKCERGGDERSLQLDCHVTKATIPGILPLGLYKISLDSLFSIKINLENENDETNRKEICLTTTETASVRFRTPGLSERPEIYLTGYTATTIDLTWNKPNMFSIIDHPEKLSEQIKIHRRLLGYRVEINGRKYNTLNEDQYQCTLTECLAGEEYKVQLVAQTVIQNEYINDTIFDDEEIDETPSKKLRARTLTNDGLLRSFQANFEFHHTVTKENTTEERNEVKPLGKINVQWTLLDTTNISHFILQWHSSKDLRIQQKHFNPNETSYTIDASDEKYFYIIEIIIVTNDGLKHQYEQLKMPIPGEPDAPKLWLVKTSDSSFIVEWSEPKSYGIPVIGFQLYIEGEKAGDMVELNLRRAEIPSNINRTYQVNVCAITNNPQRTCSDMSQTLSVITAPTTNLSPPMFFDNNEASSTSLDRKMTQTIPVKFESINEEKLYIDWRTFLPMRDIRAYYIHCTCLNNGEVQTMKVSKRHRHTILRDLKPGFTYGIMVLAVEEDGGVLYTSEKSTIQMSAPPNAPIVAIRERTTDHVTLEWRLSPSYGELAVVGYKIFINNRLVAILSHDQLTYTLTNGSACEEYTVHVQALSNDKNISSAQSRGVKFAWPGIKPGVFRRLDDGKTGTVVVAWEHPQLEDETEKLIAFKLLSENVATHAVRLHGEYDFDTHQATIYDLINGKYRLWLEIQSEHYCVRARPITIGTGRFRNRQPFIPAKCFMRKQKRVRSTTTNTIIPSTRRIQYS